MMRESLDCVSALGDGLRLEVIDHGDAGAAKEFIVAAPKFNFKKWLTLTLALRLVDLLMLCLRDASPRVNVTLRFAT